MGDGNINGTNAVTILCEAAAADYVYEYFVVWPPGTQYSVILYKWMHQVSKGRSAQKEWRGQS